MMRAFQSVIADQPADTPCNECHEELKEENEKLKEEIGMSKLVHHQNMGLSEDLKKLKEENEKLKAELNDFTSVFDGNVSMIKMKKENQKLTDENKDLNSQWAKKRDEDGDSYRIIINELKEENEKLKKEVFCTDRKLGRTTKGNDYRKERIEQLKEENEKLKEEIVKLNRLLETAVNCCDCGESESHKKTKWTYCTEDTDTNISRISPVWCCDKCLDKDD